MISYLDTFPLFYYSYSNFNTIELIILKVRDSRYHLKFKLCIFHRIMNRYVVFQYISYRKEARALHGYGGGGGETPTNVIKDSQLLKLILG